MGKRILIGLTFLFLLNSVYSYSFRLHEGNNRYWENAAELPLGIVEADKTPAKVPIIPTEFTAALKDRQIGTDLPSKENQPEFYSNQSHSSCLTESEAQMILEGGRLYDFSTKKWRTRPGLYGSKRERFISSWVSQRDRVNANWPRFLTLINSISSERKTVEPVRVSVVPIPSNRNGA